MCVVTRIYVFEQVSPSRTNGFGSAERERRVRVPSVSRFSRPGRLCASLHCSLASVIPSPAKRSRGICGFRQPITDNRQPTPDNRQLLLEPEGRNNLSPGRKSWVGCSTNPEPASAGDTLFISSHPVRNGSGRGWGTRRLHNLGAAIYGQLTTPLFSGSG